MQEPAITVIIPLYNGADFIRESLGSVLGQILPPAKIIVVDDGSTDAGPDIVLQMARDHDISLLRKPNGGQSSARNLGIAHAETPLIALLDQDDVWSPHHLRELVKPFRKESFPELGWVYSNLDEIDREGRMVMHSCLDSVPQAEHPKRSLSGCLASDMFVLPSASLINRRAFEAVGGFDERLIGYEDDDLFLRMFRHGYGNVYLNEALTKWRIFPGSTSYSPRMGRSRMIFLRKLLETFPADDFSGRFFARDLLTRRFLPTLVHEYRLAARSGDEAALRTAAEDFRVLLPHMPRRFRLMMRALLPVMARRAPARLAMRMAQWDLPFVRRAARLMLP